jgi:hypothetical protein
MAAGSVFSPNSAVSVNGGTLDVSASAQSIYSLSIGGLGSLNLGAGNLLNVTHGVTFGGTLDLLGFTPTGGSLELMSYGSFAPSSSFSSVLGLPPTGYQLLYGSNQLDLVAISNGPATWTPAGGGSWNTGSNWSGYAAPNGVGQSAAIAVPTNAQVTITLDGPQTLGSLTLGNSGSGMGGYTLATGTSGSLTLDNTAASSHIVVNGGSHAITAPLYVGGEELDVFATNNGKLTIGGGISQNAAIDLTLGGDGTGQLILSGTNNLGGSNEVATISSGTLQLLNSAALADGTSLIVGDNSFFAGGIQPAGGSNGAFVAAGGPAAAGAVQLTPVPEPGTLVLAAAGAALLLWRRGFRRKAKTADALEYRL